ncbi:MAG TPA: hypothetical protein PK412_03890 [bacterium]|nr:hypothetical protein [bacterium]
MFEKVMNKLLFVEIPAVGIIFLACRWPEFFPWFIPITAFAIIVIWTIAVPAVYFGRWLWRWWKPAPLYIYIHRDWSRYRDNVD